MRKQPAIKTNSAEAATVLSVSPAEEDQALLECIFSHSKWKLRKTHSLASAMVFLQAQRTPWFFAKRPAAGHMEGLTRSNHPPNYAPTVIVSSRLADDRCGRRLSTSGLDVLAKPFNGARSFKR